MLLIEKREYYDMRNNRCTKPVQRVVEDSTPLGMRMVPMAKPVLDSVVCEQVKYKRHHTLMKSPRPIR